MKEEINLQEELKPQNLNTLSSTGLKNPAEAANQILISATFTASPVLKVIEFWKEKLGYDFKSTVLSYNQVFQELFNPESLFRSNRGGMNVILLRFEDWLPYMEEGSSHYTELDAISDEFKQRKQSLFATLNDFINALQAFRANALCHTLVMTCPVSQNYRNYEHWKCCFMELDDLLREQTKDMELLQVLRAEDFHSQYRVVEVDDPARNEIGHIPFVDKYYLFLGTLVIRYYHWLVGKSYKVIVLDCDNTLWNGVCGEADPKEVKINGTFKQLQKFLAKQKEQGMLLCLCSKNSEEDVWQVFENRVDFPLKRNHITDYRINWQDKSINLRSLAEGLNLSLDSFIFIDDNPVECAEVQANCPEVLTLQWPKNEKYRKEFIQHTWALDHFAVTAEDSQRTLMTQQNLQRQSLLKQCVNFEDFLKSLELEVDIQPVESKHLSRVSQLTKRTNQFNFTTIRRSQSDIQSLLHNEGYEGRVVSVKDRFGEYGLVGVLIFKRSEDQLEIDSFILSCRVLGRGVEHVMMSELGKIADYDGLRYINVLFAKTEKNKPAMDFLESIARQFSESTEVSGSENSSRYLFDSGKIKDIRFVAGSTQCVEATYTRERGSLERGEVTRMEIGSNMLEQKIVEATGELTNVESIFKALQAESTKVEAEEERIMQDGNTDRKEYFKVLDEVKKIFGRTLEVDTGKINIADNLENYVRDSLKIVELTAELQKRFRGIPSTLLFEVRSLEDIAHNITEDFNREGYPAIAGGIDLQADQPFEVAIIGVNGKFPKSENMEEFWKNLLTGTSCISEVPQNRWDTAHYFDPAGKEEDKSHSKWGGFIDDVDCFDNSFFNISPKEAEMMDPQQRIFLEVVWGLLEDACYTKKNLASDTGVFVGVISNDYNIYLSEAALLGQSSYRGAEMYQIPNRVSYFMDLHGPSIAIDTACSASGTAVHLAYESMKRGECSHAIVGGVNLFLHPSRYIQYSRMQMLSKDKKCCPFGAEAAGTIFGEGIGAILLKPLRNAKEDGDNIYAVIKGTSINSGGKTNGFTVPNPNAQADMIARAMDNAKIAPRTISYVEAHGTGTPLGDPIEVRGLTNAFQQSHFSSYHQSDTGYCALGSLKSNMGHLESGAAIAGIIKTVFQLRFKTIVPSLNSTALNPMIPFETTPFYVPQKPTEWLRPVLKGEDGKEYAFPRRAGVSSFGAGGSNAHIILEEFDDSEAAAEFKGNNIPIIVLSARSEEALKKMAANLKNFIEKRTPAEAMLGRIAYSLQVGREQLKYRLAILCDSIDDLHKKLEEYLDGETGSEKILTGVVQNTLAQYVSFGKTKFDQTFLADLCKTKDFLRIASLWVVGADFYWECFYRKEHPRRMSLPTYPFAKERHWIPKVNAYLAAALRNGSGTCKGFNPLLQRIDAGKTVRMGSGIVFDTVIAPGHSSVSGHTVREESVLPAAAYIEMIRAAIKEIEGKVPVEIEEINFLQPLIIKDKTSIQLEFKLTGEHMYAFEIRCCDPELVLYSQGTIRGCEGQDDLYINYQELQATGVQMTDMEQFYENLSNLGMNYEEAYRSLRGLWVNEEEILGEIQLDNSQLESGYGCHPGLVDSAFQTRFGLAGCVPGGDRVSSMKGIRINADLPPQAFSYLKRSEDGQFYQAAVVDLSGKVIVQIQQLFTQKVKNSWDDLMYLPLWDEQPVTVLENRKRINSVLVVYSESPYRFEKTIEDYYKKNGLAENVIKVKLNNQTRRVSEMEWTCDINDPKGFEICLHAYGAIDCLYFISDGRDEKQPVNFDYLIQSQQHNEIQLLRLIKAVRQKEPVRECMDCYVITQDNHRITDACINPYGGGVTGLAYSIAHGEYRFAVRNIDISVEDMATRQRQEELMSLLVNEEPSSRGDLVKFKAGLRYKQSFIKLDVTHLNKAFGLKKGGIYVILGGSGTVGGIMTRYLMKEYNARVIWIGRKPETSDFIRERLAAFKSMGEPPLYIQADATSPEQMIAAAAKIKAFYPVINGAIFLGVVISFENSIAKTNEKDFLEILNIKSKGSINFYNAFKDERLDFMCYFSSGQAFSFSGAASLSAYAAGITFADSYVKRIRESAKYPVGIINWGFWKASVVDSPMSRNIGCLEDREGFGCFENFASLLHEGVLKQAICLKASKPVLELMKCKEEVISISDKSAVSSVQALWSKGVAKEYSLETLFKISSQKELREWMIKLLFVQLCEVGFVCKGGISKETETLRREAGILEKYNRLLIECLNILEAGGYISRESNSVKVIGNSDLKDGAKVWQAWEIAKERYRNDPDWRTKVMLLDACMQNLPGILTGKVLATDILFPGSSMKMLEGVYKGNVLSDYFNTVVADTVAEYVRQRIEADPNARIRIIEAGAGTGGTSAMVFSRLKPYEAYVEYCYTDISKAFLLFAEEKYGVENPYIKFKLNNVEKPIAQQGIEAGSYDIAISTNCLHATKNIHQTIRNIKAVLKTNGILLLNEETEKTIFTTLTFGLLDGWWLYEDENLRIPGAPLLYAETWERVLKEEGFNKVLFPVAEARNLGQQVIAAESNGVIRQKIISGSPSVKGKDITEEKLISQVKKEVGGLAGRRDTVQPPARQTVKGAAAVPSEVQEISVDKYVKDRVLGALAKSLKISVNNIDSKEAFSEYGVDSIIGISFVNQVSDILGVALNSAILFDYPTVDRLISYIIKTYKEHIKKNIALTQSNSPAQNPVKGINGLFKSVQKLVEVSDDSVPQITDDDKTIELLEKNFFEDEISIDSLIQIIKK